MMSITLLNVSWKAEELLFIALLLVQNLFCLPSLNLKTGLGLGFVFPFFVFYPVLEFVHGMCWWRIFCVSIWLLGTCLFWVTPWAVHPPFPILPQPCASGVTRQGLCLLPPIDSYELVGEGCLCSTKSVLVSNMRNRVYIFPRKTDVQECEFFCFLQGTLCGCIRHGGTATLILWAKYVLEVASSTGAKYPCVHYWCFLKFWVSLNFLYAIIFSVAYTDVRLHGSVIFWCGCKSNYFSSSKHVYISELYIQRNTVQH